MTDQGTDLTAKSEGWDAYEEVMAEERRATVLVSGRRLCSNVIR